MNGGWGISYEIALKWMLLDLTDDKFREWLGAVRQQAITWTNVDPDLSHHMASPGQNELLKLAPEEWKGMDKYIIWIPNKIIA